MCCYNCTSRVLGCHSTCNRYKDYKQQIKARNEFLGRTEGESFAIDNTVNRMVAKAKASKTQRIMRVDRSGR